MLASAAHPPSGRVGRSGVARSPSSLWGQDRRPPGPSWQLVPGPGRALTTCGLFLLLVLLQFYGFHVPSHFIFKFYCREHCRASPKLT